MISFKLNSGRKVSLVAFSFYYTYGGLIIGSPDEESNRQILSGSKYPSDWGDGRNTLNLQPTEIEIKTRLKPVFYCAWLNSDPIYSTDYTFDGSELVVIWHGDSSGNRRVKEILNSDLKNIDWNKHAKNFHF